MRQSWRSTRASAPPGSRCGRCWCRGWRNSRCRSISEQGVGADLKVGPYVLNCRLKALSAAVQEHFLPVGHHDLLQAQDVLAVAEAVADRGDRVARLQR